MLNNDFLAKYEENLIKKNYWASNWAGYWAGYRTGYWAGYYGCYSKHC